ncbi:MAG: tRNA uridine-5-carboxymethylaminomethyl(34) synthesis GTPase MnmE [Bacteroidales bacterium]|nr:tRNA uridine-5-carboxymethylaminomethyl(34) synthesis GTPase MnmE [Bacteroidales bacterium]
MTNRLSDTIVAPATIPGTGAISIIRVSGSNALEITDAVVKLKDGTISSADGYTIHYGVVPSDSEGSLLDEVLASVFRAPHSYTGEDSVEISTHASSYIVKEVIRLLLAAGARLAEPGEFTRRAFLNGKMDLAQAEAVADVIASSTSASHRVAMHQLKGSYSRELADLRSELLEMASLLELELDFSEEDVEFAGREQLNALLEKTKTHVDTLAASFYQGNLIKNGVPVAIVGPANAGKSTLLNALVGEDRAIVTDIPGTTRDTLEECITLSGIQFRFIDTAGLRESEDTVEHLGIERSYKALAGAEIVLLVLDGTQNETDLKEQISVVTERMDFSFQKLFILLNKADLAAKNGVNKIVSNVNAFVSHANNKAIIILLSAKRQEGLEELKNALIEAEKDLISSSDATFVTNVRHYEALKNASSALAACRTSLSRGTPSDLVDEDLRLALREINSILGTDLLDPETILHTIFSRHCIGK